MPVPELPPNGYCACMQKRSRAIYEQDDGGDTERSPLTKRRVGPLSTQDSEPTESEGLLRACLSRLISPAQRPTSLMELMECISSLVSSHVFFVDPQVVFTHLLINRAVGLEERVIERTPGACAFITETIVKAYPRPVGLDLQIVVPASEELGGITRLSREFHFTLRKVIRWVHDLTEREIEKEFFMQQLAAQCRTDFAADPRRVIQDFLERGFISSGSDGQVLYHLPSVLPSPGHYVSLPKVMGY